MGLPTPNIFAGEQNFHSRLEWVSVQDMEKAVEVIVELARCGRRRRGDGVRHRPLLALAPMQEVTDGAFWTLIHRYGGADIYWTEYLRVHPPPRRKSGSSTTSTNTTGRPVIAQMIGNDIPSLVRTAKFLQQLPVEPSTSTLAAPRRSSIESAPAAGCCENRSALTILGALRDAVQVKFTVKTRLGFATVDEFDALLEFLPATRWMR